MVHFFDSLVLEIGLNHFNFLVRYHPLLIINPKVVLEMVHITIQIWIALQYAMHSPCTIYGSPWIAVEIAVFWNRFHILAFRKRVSHNSWYLRKFTNLASEIWSETTSDTITIKQYRIHFGLKNHLIRPQFLFIVNWSRKKIDFWSPDLLEVVHKTIILSG
jgi:hypothetical protein